jgi:hypothetical protein
MKRLINTFASAIILLAFTACATQPTCSGEEMIAMKDKGFDQNRIEAMCMSRRLDIGGITQVISTGVQAFAAAEQAKREVKAAASKEEKKAAQLKAVADLLSRLSGKDERVYWVASCNEIFCVAGLGLPADSAFGSPLLSFPPSARLT